MNGNILESLLVLFFAMGWNGRVLFNQLDLKEIMFLVECWKL